MRSNVGEWTASGVQTSARQASALGGIGDVDEVQDNENNPVLIPLF